MLLDVTLAEVVNQLLAQLEDLDIADAGGALALAAALIKLKSSALRAAAGAGESDEEPLDIEAELLECLEAVRRLRELGGVVAAVPAAPHITNPRVERTHVAGLPATMSIEDFEAELLGIEKMISGEPALQSEPFPMATMIELLLEKVDLRLPFSAIAEGEGELRFRIALFLAVLELVRQRRLRAEQSTPFGEIALEAAS